MLAYIKNLSLKHSINLLFCLFPISFVIGSLIVTLNLYLFLILCIIYIKKKNYKLNFDYSGSILICFFLSIVISSAINHFEGDWINTNQVVVQEHPLLVAITHGYFVRSILLLRFVILYFVVQTLLINNQLSLKEFFISSFICTGFVSFDVIVQYFFGYNLLGYKWLTGEITGFFFEEAIAGGYIQKFSLLSIFGLLFFLKEKKYKKQAVFIIVLLLTLGTFLASNRMNFLLLFVSLIFLLLVTKEIRYAIISSLLVFISISVILINADESLKKRYSRFLMVDGLFINNIFFSTVASSNTTGTETKDKEEKLKKSIELNTTLPMHFRIYRTAFESWKNSPIIGWGHKSYRVNCSDIVKAKPKTFVPVCSSHPHNYQIQVLHNSGLVGFVLISIFVFLFLLKVFKSLINKNYRPHTMYLIPIVITLLIEIWPIKSTGSLFTTWNGTTVWLIIAFSTILNTNFTKKNLDQPLNNRKSLLLGVTITFFGSLIIKRLFFI